MSEKMYNKDSQFILLLIGYEIKQDVFESPPNISHPIWIELEPTRTYMLNHIEEKISVKELAERANYSVSRFCVLYNEFFSVTPVEDLLNARIQKAVSLLKYDKTSITEIAERCGFSSIHYFSRKFKEKTGVSPSEYSK